MIHVIESKPAKRYGDYFLRQIVKVLASQLMLIKRTCYFPVVCMLMPVLVQLEGVMTDVDRVKLE